LALSPSGSLFIGIHITGLLPFWATFLSIYGVVDLETGVLYLYAPTVPDGWRAG